MVQCWQRRPRRIENGWPIARTEYTRYYLTPNRELTPRNPEGVNIYPGMQDLEPCSEKPRRSTTGAIRDCTIRPGDRNHRTPCCALECIVSMSADTDRGSPTNYSTEVLPVVPGEVYPVDVEVWPTNVVVEKGGKILLEVSCHRGIRRGVRSFSIILIQSPPTNDAVPPLLPRLSPPILFTLLFPCPMHCPPGCVPLDPSTAPCQALARFALRCRRPRPQPPHETGWVHDISYLGLSPTEIRPEYKASGSACSA